MPEKFIINDNMVVPPAAPEEAPNVEILRGPNIKPFPVNKPLAESIESGVTLKVGDNITTDHIMPAGAKILPLRSNIPAISEYCFTVCDETFPKRAKEAGTSIIVGGTNYGQGSSREHAAITPMFLGVKAVIAKSMARIHKNNLINHGIVPMVFADPADYDKLELSDELSIPNFREQIKTKRVTVVDKTKGISFDAVLELSDDEVGVILEGGQLRYVQEQLKKA